MDGGEGIVMHRRTTMKVRKWLENIKLGLMGEQGTVVVHLGAGVQGGAEPVTGKGWGTLQASGGEMVNDTVWRGE